MFSDKRLEEFVEKMSKAMSEKEYVYGDSWKTESILFLEQRLTAKANEFRLTKNPDKLISLANLAMLLYARMNENGDNNG